ncbi:type II toxin-antitoxin system RelE family toxin [Tellurirhabdus rosea]|uniref:type II toxin-antitoxin system RelE family toxin n=1 Tax=Tellurirhabdus rosea TaxID=2674997 RepID=UPI00225BDCBC|nr:type II toxin-antitoxin system RelE/ParE family toxin [Tellurirhabdus rosea]
MKEYTVVIEKTALKFLGAVQPETRRRIAKAIDALARQPRPPGCKKLNGVSTLYRIRVGDYRVIYTIRDEQLLVLVIKIGDRKEIYD